METRLQSPQRGTSALDHWAVSPALTESLNWFSAFKFSFILLPGVSILGSQKSWTGLGYLSLFCSNFHFFLLCFLGEFFNFDFQVFRFTLLILNAKNSLCRHVHAHKHVSNRILCISMKIDVYSQANIDCGLSVAVFLVLSCEVPWKVHSFACFALSFICHSYQISFWWVVCIS